MADKHPAAVALGKLNKGKSSPKKALSSAENGRRAAIRRKEIQAKLRAQLEHAACLLENLVDALHEYGAPESANLAAQEVVDILTLLTDIDRGRA